MVDYTKHNDVIELLTKAQDAEKDLREIVRETHHFLDKRDGQWEPEIYSKFCAYGRPRYTFDQCNPVVDQIAGELEQADFDIKILPADGDASEDNAKVLDGLIRNIEKQSNASDVYSAAGRSMIAAGLDGWRITQEYADSDSFNQELFVRKIPNFVDRAWLDPAREMQSGADCQYGFILHNIPLSEYKERWPEGSQQSVSDGRDSSAYTYKQQDTVIVGEFFYLAEKPRELVLMSNGAVYAVNDDFDKVVDELSQLGVTEVRRRNRPETICKVRKFDQRGWLSDEKDTVFSYIPIIATYGNFKISENKILFRGAIEKLLDSQRVLNYALSRDIEEGALAPRDKIWMTDEQAKGHQASLSTLNTNTDPVQLYSADETAPPPFRPSPATPNVGLQTTASNMTMAIQRAAGMPDAARGDNAGLQSGFAIQQLQTKSDTATIKWFKSQEVAIQHTAQILLKAIPKVYDTQQQIRILGEDGMTSMVTVNQTIVDQQSGELVTLNDLTRGKYDAVCSAGPSFVSRQQESVTAITEIAKIDPSVMELGGDVMLNNIGTPGIDLIAARRRAIMVQQGIIPEDQLTDDERQQLAMMAQQPQPPDAMMIAAQAEVMKAEADMMEAQNKQAELILKAQEQEIKIAELAQKGQKVDIERARAIADIRNTDANTIKTMTEAEKNTAQTTKEQLDTLARFSPVVQ